MENEMEFERDVSNNSLASFSEINNTSLSSRLKSSSDGEFVFYFILLPNYVGMSFIHDYLNYLFLKINSSLFNHTTWIDLDS